MGLFDSLGVTKTHSRSCNSKTIRSPSPTSKRSSTGRSLELVLVAARSVYFFIFSRNASSVTYIASSRPQTGRRFHSSMTWLESPFRSGARGIWESQRGSRFPKRRGEFACMARPCDKTIAYDDHHASNRSRTVLQLLSYAHHVISNCTYRTCELYCPTPSASLLRPKLPVPVVIVGAYGVVGSCRESYCRWPLQRPCVPKSRMSSSCSSRFVHARVSCAGTVTTHLDSMRGQIPPHCRA